MTIDEVSFASHVEGLLNVLLRREPRTQLRQQLRPFALDLQRDDEERRAPDLPRIDDRSISNDHAFRAHSSYPSLDRRGRQPHLFGEALRGLRRVLLEEIQQLTVKSIEFHDCTYRRSRLTRKKCAVAAAQIAAKARGCARTILTRTQFF